MSEIVQDWGIHWFRRDLRIQGNLALEANLKKTQGRTLGLFCFDSKFLSREDFSNNRFAFFLDTISNLKNDLQNIGVDLLVVDGQPQDVFERIVESRTLSSRKLPSIVTWNRDYEPFAVKRDANIELVLKTKSIHFENFRDHLLFEPLEILKPSSTDFYKIYSPWAKRWFEKLKSDEGRERIRTSGTFSGLEKSEHSLTWKQLDSKLPLTDELESFRTKNAEHVSIAVPDSGFEAGIRELKTFLPHVTHYNENRDFPVLDATSKLSMFLKNGSLNIAHILSQLDLSKCAYDKTDGVSKYVRELAWREFYYSILYFRPDVETGPFQKKYGNVTWSENDAHFTAWKEGRTGVPIVDAGMRELAKTGWITNRIRIIVSTFLTKDLLINWQWGEKHFMHLLLDGDLAPNNGNWQWASSTGSDPNPYFRILNPWTQAKKFDSDAAYIKRHVEELKSAPASIIHDPDADRSRYGYHAPIVNHSAAREVAIKAFAEV